MSNKVHPRKRNKAGDTRWDIVCEPAILEKLKTQERFWQVIALARSVNALSFAHWAMVPVLEDDSWHGKRTRTNSFFFECAILYEALLLVEQMNKNFHTEDTFAGLKAILKDKTARKIRSLHLGRARNNVCFTTCQNRLVKSSTYLVFRNVLSWRVSVRPAYRATIRSRMFSPWSFSLGLRQIIPSSSMTFLVN